MTDQGKPIATIEGKLRRDADAIALHHLRKLIHQDGRANLCFHFEDLTLSETYHQFAFFHILLIAYLLVPQLS